MRISICGLIVLAACMLTACLPEAAIAEADAQAAPFDAQAQIARDQLDAQYKLAALQMTSQANSASLMATQDAQTVTVLQEVIKTQQAEQRRQSLILPLALVLAALIVVAGLVWSSILRRPAVFLPPPVQLLEAPEDAGPIYPAPLYIRKRAIIPVQRGRNEL